MISLLSSIGRFSISLAAIAMTIGAAVFGYFFTRGQEYGIAGQLMPFAGTFTPFEAFGILFGCGMGFVLAGAIFGVAATLYDIRDSLRIIAARHSTDSAEQKEKPRFEPRY